MTQIGKFSFISLYMSLLPKQCSYILREKWALIDSVEEGTSKYPTNYPWRKHPNHHASHETDVIVYNKSRDNDRICPACRRWYRVGEKGFKEYNNFQDFLNRPTILAPEVPLIVAAFNDVRIKNPTQIL
jgi:hypothetical protein